MHSTGQAKTRKSELQAFSLQKYSWGRTTLSILNQMKSSKIEGHFRVYIAFFGAKIKLFKEMAGLHDSEHRKKSSFRSETGAYDHGTFIY
jgi:hypothetical protein